jgi:hypothetical protein
MKVFIVLDRKTLVSALVNMTVTRGAVMGVVSLGMSQRDPANESRHFAVDLGGKHHVPMIAHPLVSDQVDLELFQTFGNQPLERFEISVLEKDIMSRVAPVERVINAACLIGAWWSSHDVLQTVEKCVQLNVFTCEQAVAALWRFTPFLIVNTTKVALSN